MQARGQLHTGQQVQYLHCDDGKLRDARVVAMKDRRVRVPYAAIVKSESSVTQAGAAASAQGKRTPPPEIAARDRRLR